MQDQFFLQRADVRYGPILCYGKAYSGSLVAGSLQSDGGIVHNFELWIDLRYAYINRNRLLRARCVVVYVDDVLARYMSRCINPTSELRNHSNSPDGLSTQVSISSSRISSQVTLMMNSAFGSMMPVLAGGFSSMIAIKNMKTKPSNALNSRSVNGSLS